MGATVINDGKQPDENPSVHCTSTKSHHCLGLPPKAVRLKKHNAEWGTLYQIEASALRNVVGDALLGIEHVGSTCIEGLLAKPIIDILAGVDTLERGAALAPLLQTVGYSYLGGHLVPGHHVFGKGVSRTHLLHVVEFQGSAWRRVIAFRDILVKYPDIAVRYETQKVRLSQKFKADRAGYGEAKTPYIDDILAEFGGIV